jgi:hypothetical protein
MMERRLKRPDAPDDRPLLYAPEDVLEELMLYRGREVWKEQRLREVATEPKSVLFWRVMWPRRTAPAGSWQQFKAVVH